MSSITTTTDPTPLTEAEIQRIADLEAKATSAPWLASSKFSDMIEVSGSCDTIDCPVYSSIAQFDDTEQEDSDGRVWTCSGDGWEANRDFVVALRNVAPSLITAAERCERAEARVRELESRLKMWDELVAFLESIGQERGRSSPAIKDDKLITNALLTQVSRVRELEEAVRVLEYLQQHAFRDESTKKNVVVVRDLDLHSMTDTRLRNGITSFFTPIARAAVEGVNA